MASHSNVSVQAEDFDVSSLQRELLDDACEAGAVASFTGLVKTGGEHQQVSALELEHYPGMTERSIQAIVDEARQRWQLSAVKVVHRIGRLEPGEQIVYVGVCSAHRREAFQACEFIMDYLKTRAPFWKKETSAAGEYWVDSRESDFSAARRWQIS